MKTYTASHIDRQRAKPIELRYARKQFALVLANKIMDEWLRDNPAAFSSSVLPDDRTKYTLSVNMEPVQ